MMTKLKLVIVATFFFSSLSLAETIEKASNTDLRTGSLSKFVVENIKDSDKVELLQNDSSYVLLYLKKKHEAGRKRLSVEEADKIDQMILGKFIQLKYSLPGYSGKKCKAAVNMTVRDEIFTICNDEKEKLELAQNIFKDLQNFF